MPKLLGGIHSDIKNIVGKEMDVGGVVQKKPQIGQLSNNMYKQKNRGCKQPLSTVINKLN